MTDEELRAWVAATIAIHTPPPIPWTLSYRIAMHDACGRPVKKKKNKGR